MTCFNQYIIKKTKIIAKFTDSYSNSEKEKGKSFNMTYRKDANPNILETICIIYQ